VELVGTNYLFGHQHNEQLQKKNLIIEINGIKQLITGTDSDVKLKG
jgi:hypothetical protein